MSTYERPNFRRSHSLAIGAAFVSRSGRSDEGSEACGLKPRRSDNPTHAYPRGERPVLTATLARSCQSFCSVLNTPLGALGLAAGCEAPQPQLGPAGAIWRGFPGGGLALPLSSLLRCNTFSGIQKAKNSKNDHSHPSDINHGHFIFQGRCAEAKHWRFFLGSPVRSEPPAERQSVIGKPDLVSIMARSCGLFCAVLDIGPLSLIRCSGLPGQHGDGSSQFAVPFSPARLRQELILGHATKWRIRGCWLLD